METDPYIPKALASRSSFGEMNSVAAAMAAAGYSFAAAAPMPALQMQQQQHHHHPPAAAAPPAPVVTAAATQPTIDISQLALAWPHLHPVHSLHHPIHLRCPVPLSQIAARQQSAIAQQTASAAGASAFAIQQHPPQPLPITVQAKPEATHLIQFNTTNIMPGFNPHLFMQNSIQMSPAVYQQYTYTTVRPPMPLRIPAQPQLPKMVLVLPPGTTAAAAAPLLAQSFAQTAKPKQKPRHDLEYDCPKLELEGPSNVQLMEEDDEGPPVLTPPPELDPDDRRVTSSAGPPVLTSAITPPTTPEDDDDANAIIVVDDVPSVPPVLEAASNSSSSSSEKKPALIAAKLEPGTFPCTGSSASDTCSASQASTDSCDVVVPTPSSIDSSPSPSQLHYQAECTASPHLLPAFPKSESLSLIRQTTSPFRTKRQVRLKRSYTPEAVPQQQSQKKKAREEFVECCWEGCSVTKQSTTELYDHVKQVHVESLARFADPYEDPCDKSDVNFDVSFIMRDLLDDVLSRLECDDDFSDPDPFQCLWADCEKTSVRGDAIRKFNWLKSHVASRHFRTASTLCCLIAGCSERFASQRQLDEHIRVGHASNDEAGYQPGTLWRSYLEARPPEYPKPPSRLNGYSQQQISRFLHNVLEKGGGLNCEFSFETVKPPDVSGSAWRKMRKPPRRLVVTPHKSLLA